MVFSEAHRSSPPRALVLTPSDVSSFRTMTRWTLIFGCLAACSDTSAPLATKDTHPTTDLVTVRDSAERPDIELDTAEPASPDTPTSTPDSTAPELPLPDTPDNPEPDSSAPPDTSAPPTPDTHEDETDPGPDLLGDESDLLDLIYGVDVPRTSSWWVDETTLHRGRDPVRLVGLNWFGLETPDRALHGTWFGRSVESFLAELASLGFNALRIPVSPQSIHPGFPSAAWSHDAYTSGPATTGREHLERLLAAASEAGFAILLDLHTCHPDQLGQALPGSPDGCPGYTLDTWKADLAALATLARPHPHVLGIDLFNEPHALTWAEWKTRVEAGAESVLTANPTLLIFVEGVADRSPFGAHYPFWGGNLTEAGQNPPAIPRSRLVYSPHTYGPGVSAQSYFAAADFPANMPGIWHGHFGHLAATHPVVVGEFGGFYDETHPGEISWNEAFVAYLATLDRGRPASFFYWALNPNSGDTGGLYEDDWVTLVPRRLALLAPLLAPDNQRP